MRALVVKLDSNTQTRLSRFTKRRRFSLTAKTSNFSILPLLILNEFTISIPNKTQSLLLSNEKELLIFH